MAEQKPFLNWDNSSDTQLQLGQPRTVTGEGCVPSTGLEFSVRSSVHKPQGCPALPPTTLHQVISLVLVGGLTHWKMDANTEGYDIPEGSSVRVQHIHTAPKNTCCCLCLSWCTPVLISRRGNITGEKVLGKKLKEKKILKEKISIINHKSCSLKNPKTANSILLGA